MKKLVLQRKGASEVGNSKKIVITVRKRRPPAPNVDNGWAYVRTMPNITRATMGYYAKESEVPALIYDDGCVGPLRPEGVIPLLDICTTIYGKPFYEQDKLLPSSGFFAGVYLHDPKDGLVYVQFAQPSAFKTEARCNDHLEWSLHYRNYAHEREVELVDKAEHRRMMVPDIELAGTLEKCRDFTWTKASVSLPSKPKIKLVAVDLFFDVQHFS